MSHSPSRYDLSFATIADLVAYSNANFTLDDGDIAFVLETQSTYRLSSAGGEPAANGITSISVQAGDFLWVLVSAETSFTVHYDFGGAAFDYHSSLVLAGANVTIAHTATGNWLVTFQAASGVTPIKAALASGNGDDFGGASAFVASANTVRVRTFAVAFPDAPAASDMSFTLTVWI